MLHEAGRPRIGITVDVDSNSYRCRFPYADMVIGAGGVPLLLPCIEEAIPDYLSICDGFVTTGGDDPDMTMFDVANHPSIKTIDPRRQAFEMKLLGHLDATDHPILAICLGMQLMGLAAGGTLDQHLPDTLPTAALHWDGGEHDIDGVLGTGSVHSHHRQALVDPGTLEVVARAPDGVIEAVRDANRPERLGVQWHPERTTTTDLGPGLFSRLVEVALKGTRAH